MSLQVPGYIACFDDSNKRIIEGDAVYSMRMHIEYKVWDK